MVYISDVYNFYTSPPPLNIPSTFSAHRNIRFSHRAYISYITENIYAVELDCGIFPLMPCLDWELYSGLGGW